jgi:hypothetical protein
MIFSPVIKNSWDRNSVLLLPEISFILTKIHILPMKNAVWTALRMRWDPGPLGRIRTFGAESGSGSELIAFDIYTFFVMTSMNTAPRNNAFYVLKLSCWKTFWYKILYKAGFGQKLSGSATLVLKQYIFAFKMSSFPVEGRKTCYQSSTSLLLMTYRYSIE